MLKYRILTAIFLLFVIVAMVFLLKPPVFALALSIFFILGANEWAGLMGLMAVTGRVAYVFLVMLGLCSAYFLPPMLLFCVTLILWLWAAAAVYACQQDRGLLGFEEKWVKALTGILMLVGCWKSILVLQATSPFGLLAAFILIWLVDIGAFFSGRRWGRHPLADRISPKKTREGFWGGILLSVAVLSLGSFFLEITWQQRVLFIVLAFIGALFAVVGDLFISLLKRNAGIKDTGTLLPGHGGLLDRVDSTLSTLPIVALGFLLFGRLAVL